MASPAWSPSKVPDVSDPSSVPGTPGATIAPSGVASGEAFGVASISVGGFAGDFAALAATYSLTAVCFFRGDLGVTGTSGTGKASWANQSGSASAITPHGTATNGIGSVGAGLNSKASVLSDGSTQKGLFTAPAAVAPGTLNFHRYFIAKQLAGGSSSPRGLLQSTGAGYDIYMSSAQGINTVTGGGTPINLSAGITDGVWNRIRASYTNSSSDELRVGATSGTAAGGNGVIDTARLFGDLLTKWEWLMYLEVTGTKANFLSFAADADTKAQSFWTSAIQI